MPRSSDTGMMTVGQATVLLNISKRKMAQLIKEGKLITTPDPLDKRLKWVKRSDVEAILAQSPKKEAVA
jgi:hypothetical protein